MSEFTTPIQRVHTFTPSKINTHVTSVRIFHDRDTHVTVYGNEDVFLTMDCLQAAGTVMDLDIIMRPTDELTIVCSLPTSLILTYEEQDEDVTTLGDLLNDGPHVHIVKEEKEETESQGWKPDEMRTDIDISEVTKGFCT